MSTTKKAAGGITILGVLGFAIHFIHPLFNIIESNKKPDYSNMEIIMNDPAIKRHVIKNIDSILKIEDKVLRDSLLKEAIHESISNDISNKSNKSEN